MAILERLQDEHGIIILGLLGDRVIYARFSGALSAELARRFARRFRSLVGDVEAVRYFGDYSALDSYDVAAVAIVFDVFLEKRDQFQLIALRPWPAAPSEKVRSLIDAVGCIELVASAEEFDDRLRTAAPLAKLGAVTLAQPAATSSLAGSAAIPASIPRSEEATPAPPDKEPRVYTYVFELDDFERGRFIATRNAHIAVRPKGAWLCVARNDEEALALARQAALFEWAPPQTRPPQDFTVRFVEPSQRPFDRGR